MALVVEDGTFKADAEAYVSTSDFDAYWTKRNDATSVALSTAVKEAAIRQATMFLDNSYSFLGERNTTTQALEWPRVLPYGIDNGRKAVSSTEIPQAIKDASCELAKIATTAELAETLDRGGRVTSERIDTIAVTYADDAPVAKMYQYVELLLKRLTEQPSLSDTVWRA